MRGNAATALGNPPRFTEEDTMTESNHPLETEREARALPAVRAV